VLFNDTESTTTFPTAARGQPATRNRWGCRQGRSHTTILGQPATGLRDKVGERGLKLSGGEKTRASRFARTLMKESG